MKARKLLVLTSALAILLSLVMLSAGPASAEPTPGGTTLSATVDITPHWNITYHWTIDKTVVPATWELFRGDSGTSMYTITVTKDQGTEQAWVDGQVCVTNGGALATENLTISAELRDGVPPPDDLITTISVDVSGKPVLNSGETHCYPYHIDVPLPPHAGGTYKVTANVTITNHSGSLGIPSGPNPSASGPFLAVPVVTNGSINVDDTNGGSWLFENSGAVSYDKSFTCDGDKGTHNNTATIRGTDQSDSASVTVNCYVLEVTKDAATSLKRTYKWTIDKSADQSKLTLAVGQQFQVNYSVIVNVSGFTDSDWAVTGNIAVHNPAPIAGTINSVTDQVSGVGAAVVNCGVTFPYTLTAGGTLNCTYSLSLPDAANRTNTATATLQNYTYDKDLIATPGGTTGFTGSAPVSFSTPALNSVDECIAVSDTYAGSLGTVCVGDAPKTFTYSRTVGKYDVCGDYTVDNTATFVTNDSAATSSDSWTVAVNVPCPGGCTLTQGYWKTHSKYGPAPYDDAWALLTPNGEDTIFYLSGQSYYNVLWTNPRGGNAYYILAHQYIAAVLNRLNGASSNATVNGALSWAATFFNTYTPGFTLSKTVRNTALNNAFILDQYNNGFTGPGHCSDNTSERSSLLLYFDNVIALPFVKR
jgi:hypothetical protein